VRLTLGGVVATQPTLETVAFGPVRFQANRSRIAGITRIELFAPISVKASDPNPAETVRAFA